VVVQDYAKLKSYLNGNGTRPKGEFKVVEVIEQQQKADRLKQQLLTQLQGRLSLKKLETFA
jgi:hypothetical protein